MDTQAVGGVTLHRAKIENFLKGKQPSIVRFAWRLPPDNFDWNGASRRTLENL